MATKDRLETHVLYTIIFSHYNEKARWAFDYYGITYLQHALLPVLHRLTVQPVPAQGKTSEAEPKPSSCTTPRLVVLDEQQRPKRVLGESSEIVEYLSTTYASPERPCLYNSCGADKAGHVRELEARYDKVLGVAARAYFYNDLLVAGRWQTLLPFAMLGFHNGVGILQACLWFLFAPLFMDFLPVVLGAKARTQEQWAELCREEFRTASDGWSPSSLAAFSPG